MTPLHTMRLLLGNLVVDRGFGFCEVTSKKNIKISGVSIFASTDEAGEMDMLNFRCLLKESEWVRFWRLAERLGEARMM